MTLADSPVTIGVPTSEVGRFALFTVSLAGTRQPGGSAISLMASASVTENLNQIIRQMPDDHAALWILGDDHVWEPDALLRMLTLADDNDTDILVPLCCKRNPPWNLVLYHDADEDDDGYPRFDPYTFQEIPDDDVFEVDAAGSAGMLIRRQVLDAIGDPWFWNKPDRAGRATVLHEDVQFCRTARSLGYKIHATPRVSLGHIGLFRVWPAQRDGQWGCLTEFSAVDDAFKHVFMPAPDIQHASAPA